VLSGLFKNRVRILLYLTALALVVAIASSFQRQAGSEEGKVIEVGLIESGDQPALYFSLKNTGKNLANYTYIVTYNLSNIDLQRDTSSIHVPPNQTFTYTNSLTRPTSGITVLNLRIFRVEGASDTSTLIHNQTWIVKAQTRATHS